MWPICPLSPISRASTLTSLACYAFKPSSEHPRLLPEAGLLSSRTLFHPGDPLGVHLTLDFWLVIRAQPPIHPLSGRTALTPLLDDAVPAPALSVLRCSHPRVGAPASPAHRSSRRPSRLPAPTHQPTLPSSPAPVSPIHVHCRRDPE